MKKQNTIQESIPPDNIIRGRSIINVKETIPSITNEKTILLFLKINSKKN